MDGINTEIKIRQALPSDACAIVRIYVYSWSAGFGPRMATIKADAARIRRWRTGVGKALMSVALEGPCVRKGIVGQFYGH